MGHKEGAEVQAQSLQGFMKHFGIACLEDWNQGQV